MLTSKEIIERTGISRATLNNYIGSGLVPRPQVLPPGPQDGAAPRIGYFPDDTIARIEAIQQFKREGWSIARIAQHLAAHPPGQATAAVSSQTTPATAPVSAAPAAPRRGLPQLPSVPEAPQPVAGALAAAAGSWQPSRLAPDATPGLWLREVRQPAYLVDEAFRVLWLNDEARGPLSPLAQAAGALGANLFAHLVASEPSAGREALLRFHLEVAKDRGAQPGSLFADLAPEQVATLSALYRAVERPDATLVGQAPLPAAGGLPARRIYAVHFRDGVLFACAPELARPAAGAPAAVPAQPAAPAVTPVAVLVGTLQDAAGLWVKLTAQEYFELLHEVGNELNAIFARHRGSPGVHAGEVLDCYFLPGTEGSHLWNALAAAQQAREAMRQVSQRWQVRKGWDLELCLNLGIAEGQDWIGAIGIGAAGLRVRGDAADGAGQLSRCSRMGAVLVTRNLLGKLTPAERQLVTYGVPRLEGTRGEAPLLFTFARLADLAAPTPVAARFADLAVAELLDLHFPNASPAARGSA